MRSIGVGDYDVDEDHVRIERVSVNILPIVVEINIRCDVRFIIFSSCLPWILFENGRIKTATWTFFTIIAFSTRKK